MGFTHKGIRITSKLLASLLTTQTLECSMVFTARCSPSWSLNMWRIELWLPSSLTGIFYFCPGGECSCYNRRMLLWIFLPGCLLLIMSLIALYCLCYCDSTIAVIKEADKNSGSRLLRAWNRQPQP